MILICAHAVWVEDVVVYVMNQRSQGMSKDKKPPIEPTRMAEMILDWFHEKDQHIQDSLCPFINWDYLMDVHEYDDKYEQSLDDTFIREHGFDEETMAELKERASHLRLVKKEEEDE